MQEDEDRVEDDDGDSPPLHMSTAAQAAALSAFLSLSNSDSGNQPLCPMHTFNSTITAHPPANTYCIVNVRTRFTLQTITVDCCLFLFVFSFLF